MRSRLYHSSRDASCEYKNFVSAISMCSSGIPMSWSRDNVRQTSECHYKTVSLIFLSLLFLSFSFSFSIFLCLSFSLLFSFHYWSFYLPASNVIVVAVANHVSIYFPYFCRSWTQRTTFDRVRSKFFRPSVKRDDVDSTKHCVQTAPSTPYLWDSRTTTGIVTCGGLRNSSVGHPILPHGHSERWDGGVSMQTQLHFLPLMIQPLTLANNNSRWSLTKTARDPWLCRQLQLIDCWDQLKSRTHSRIGQWFVRFDQGDERNQ